tara:strand:+ start:2992 stop:3168 length:177 start_codon:yes stop_codon:yes gene_type:complete
MVSDFTKWLNKGIKKGWITPPYCNAHETCHPNDLEEFTELYDDYGGIDFCWRVVRIYD